MGREIVLLALLEPEVQPLLQKVRRCVDRGRRWREGARGVTCPCAPPAAWGSHRRDRTRSSKTPEFEWTEGSRRLRYIQVLRLEQNTPQQAPALFRICPVGELGRRVMRTRVCVRSC